MVLQEHFQSSATSVDVEFDRTLPDPDATIARRPEGFDDLLVEHGVLTAQTAQNEAPILGRDENFLPRTLKQLAEHVNASSIANWLTEALRARPDMQDKDVTAATLKELEDSTEQELSRSTRAQIIFLSEMYQPKAA